MQRQPCRICWVLCESGNRQIVVVGECIIFKKVSSIYTRGGTSHDGLSTTPPTTYETRPHSSHDRQGAFEWRLHGRRWFLWHWGLGGRHPGRMSRYTVHLHPQARPGSPHPNPLHVDWPTSQCKDTGREYSPQLYCIRVFDIEFHVDMFYISHVGDFPWTFHSPMHTMRLFQRWRFQ